MTDPEHIRQDLRLEVSGPAATLILNRPAKRNAITVAMWAAIPALLGGLPPSVRLLIIRGAGGSFSAGADIAEFPTIYASREAAMANHQTIQAAMQAVERLPIASIAAIQGACVGGGCGLALACDFRLARADARMGITPSKLGLAYGLADTRRLVEAVGVSMAKDILLSGRLLDAEEALRLGMVNEVAPAEAFDSALQTMADRLLAGAPFTARAVKQMLRAIEAGGLEDDEESRALFAAAFEGPDFQEGFRAFMEKRAPRFS